ncbi:MipA/OmpV family protein [Qipengyuania spongiae]|uniref:MipA/OmpV family protein n=1 Tax=Qipengyuania spongiae TaxID=2909673 RepID=A0ABY5T2L5_9SPHN|nr:MipA/OmpV family protein [Qipengyuania spongiae]UVI40346.1 MipA/OmpV family protein [Qipengyuania spongiae]
MIRRLALAAGTIALATPLAAQEAPPAGSGDVYDGTVFDGDYLTIGAGVAYLPSYTGSDDYVLTPFPAVQGSIAGIDITPRAGGVALDFIPDAGSGPDLALGVAARIRRDRATQIEDPVVASLGELDTAFEVGPSAGISFPAVLNPYDSLSFNADVLWDVAGAHDGMSITPSVTYFTPLSRGIAASLSVSANHVDDDFADYYFSVTPAASLTSGLPVYDADSGFRDVGATLFVAYDLDGDLTNGGFAIAGLAGYSSLLGDFKETPFTSIRGDADQYFVGLGLGYTF